MILVLYPRCQRKNRECSSYQHSLANGHCKSLTTVCFRIPERSVSTCTILSSPRAKWI